MILHNQLTELGWKGDTNDACCEYCEFHGLQHDDGGELAATMSHIASRSCMVPDRLVESEANWPKSCRDNLGMFWDWGGFNANTVGFSISKAIEIVDKALAHWNSKVGLRLFRSTDFDTAAVCSVKWVGLGGSTLAWSHFPDNSCNADKRQRYDNNRRWTEHQFYQTVLHECGHLVGLTHRRGKFVMNATIITSLDGLTDRDVQDAMALGYGEPFNDQPDPPTDQVIASGSITLTDGTVIGAERIRSTQFGFTQTGKPPPDDGVIVLPPP